MAERDDEYDESDDSREEGLPSAPKGRSFKKILLVVIPLALLLLGGGSWLFVSGRLASLLGHPPAGGTDAPSPPPPAELAYYDLPEILVNLNAPKGREVYLKLLVSLQLNRAADQGFLDGSLPVITDSLEGYLRELRVEDLKEPGNMEALRSELLSRLNGRLKPVVIKDILFKEMNLGTIR